MSQEDAGVFSAVSGRGAAGRLGVRGARMEVQGRRRNAGDSPGRGKGRLGADGTAGVSERQSEGKGMEGQRGVSAGRRAGGHPGKSTDAEGQSSAEVPDGSGHVRGR